MKANRRGFLKALGGALAGAPALPAIAKSIEQNTSERERTAVPKPEKNDDILDSERAKQVMQHSETMTSGSSMCNNSCFLTSAWASTTQAIHYGSYR